jgi:hypothetical protein
MPDLLPDSILSCDSLTIISFALPIGSPVQIDSVYFRSVIVGNSGPGIFNLTTGLWDVSVKNEGLYVLEIFDMDNCVTYESVDVKINPNPKYDLIYDCPDVKIVLRDIISFSPYSIENKFVNSDSASVSFPFDGVYSAKIPVTNLCGGLDTIDLSIPYFCAGKDLIWAPNAFTPNDDGVNDEFCIFSSYGDAIRYEIYNRWGHKVFSALPHDCWSPSMSTTGVFLVRLIYPEVEGHSPKVLEMTITALP